MQLILSKNRPAADDLPALNAVVEAAVLSWDLAERVKRLALPSYRYTAHDLEHLGFVVARDEPQGRPIGVAAWEDAAPGSCPPGRSALLLHGLYVLPDRQGAGVGSALLREVLAEAAAQGRDGVLVRAQREAEGFFRRHGFERLDVADPLRDYQGRYWLAVRR